MIQRFEISFEDMRSSFCFGQFKFGSTADDFNAVIDPSAHKVLDVHCARQTMIESEHVAAKRHLQIAVFVELIDDHIGNFPTFYFQYDAHSIFVRLISNIGESCNHLFIDQTRNPFDEARFVDVVRNFINDDRLLVVRPFFYSHQSAKHQFATPGMIRFFDSTVAANNAARWEVRPRHHLHDFIDADQPIL